jgi:rfaE bifunctional protein nucleotidyltransferase chain/domain
MEGRQSEPLKVWVNGTFDVLHRGHLELLEFASSLGTLRVGVDTDKRVKQLKGETRPVNTCEDRIFFISKIKGVETVVSFGSDEELIENIQQWSPDYLVVGSDYKDKKVIGSDYSKEIIFFDKIDGYSSTKIINYGRDFSNR